MALALYRKHRPKTLEEVIGQETTMMILKNAAARGAFGHAYLFYGARGTGKTTTARLLAKLLNCEKREKDEAFRKKGVPCNECARCREIDAGRALDVAEIDAASNRGIDEMRNLKDSIAASPTSSPYKIYIIDEAHMLTGPAFNALLKTLEEPPAHGVIILATTEYEKLPATITSRTQRFLFRKLPRAKIAEKLKREAVAEKIKISDAALDLIAASAEGSVRDAESLLDQIASLSRDIDTETVERLTGRVDFKKVDRLAELILKRDLPGALDHLSKLTADGYNLVSATRDLIHYLRRILSLKMSPALEELYHIELTAEEIERVKKLGTLLSPDVAVKLLRALIRAYAEMRYSPFAAIPLEIVLIENLSA